MSARCEPIRNVLYLRIHSFALRLARRKAAKLAHILGLPAAEQEDVSQEVLTHIWVSLRAFDHRRSTLQTFVCRVVENRAITIIRLYTAGKRSGRVISVETVTGCDDDRLDRRSVECAADCCWRSSDHISTLRIDVARALAKLPQELRQIAWPLALQNRAEAARQLGLSRGALHRRIARIRAVFIEHGLHEYARSSTQPRRCSAPLAGGVHHR